MYYTEIKGKVISIHLTIRGAQDALNDHWHSDIRGETMYIKDVNLLDASYAIGSVVVAITIGVLLAWRG